MTNSPWINGEDGFSVRQAAEYWKVSTKTIRRRCEEHPISRHSGGTRARIVSQIMLALVMHGKYEGLQAVLEGDYSHPDVIWAYDKIGLPLPGHI